MGTLERLRWLIENALTVAIDANDHRNYYEKDADHAADCFKVYVYPDTPVGGWHIQGSTLDDVIERAWRTLREHRGLKVE